MNVGIDNGKKVQWILLRDHCGNPHYVHVGDQMPPRHRLNIGEEVTEIYIEASHHGEFDMFNIAIQLSNGNRELWNIKHVEGFQLVKV